MFGVYLLIVFISIVYGFLIDPFLCMSSEGDGVKRSDQLKIHCLVSLIFPLMLVVYVLFKLLNKIFFKK
jgi:hypothetical protein